MVVIIGSGNGLVPSGTQPLPEPMLTKISNTILVLLGHNELKEWVLLWELSSNIVVECHCMGFQNLVNIGSDNGQTSLCRFVWWVAEFTDWI